MVELIKHERKQLDTECKADIEQTEWTWNDGSSVEVETHFAENPDCSIRYLDGVKRWVMIIKANDKFGNKVEFKIFSEQKPTQDFNVV